MVKTPDQGEENSSAICKECVCNYSLYVALSSGRGFLFGMVWQRSKNEVKHRYKDWVLKISFWCGLCQVFFEGFLCQRIFWDFCVRKFFGISVSGNFFGFLCQKKF
jgi:hypothetical protein